MPIDFPTIDRNLLYYSENRIIRTGQLLFYDALLLSDLFTSSLSALNILYATLPSVDPTTHILPSGINASIQNLTINFGTGMGIELGLSTESGGIATGELTTEAYYG